VALVAAAMAASAAGPLSPSAMVADGESLWIACASGRVLLRLDLAARKVKLRTPLPGPGTGVARSPDGARLYVTCGSASSVVAVVDARTGRTVARWRAGHTAMAPVASADGKRLYVCNRFDDDVSEMDAASGRTVRRIAVEREPVAAALSADGRRLLVANFLHNTRADAEVVAAGVSIIDVAAGRVEKTLRLPNGSGSVRDVRVSPRGDWAAATHLVGRHNLPTTQLERGWMNTNAVTLIDMRRMETAGTALLDGPFHGAANPWGVAWSADGATLAVAHAGAHEVSLTDARALAAKLARATAEEPSNDLAFLTGLRRTIALAEGDRGPRALVIAGGSAYAANYFSDTVSAVDLADASRPPQSIALGPKPPERVARRGEEYFHDASLCFQRWQSCASCHPGEGRSDGLNWDLLNDGLGNPKNSKSMLLAHRTPPAMSLGVRDSAATAVRSGFHHIQFSEPPESVPAAVDAYLKALRPTPSPHLRNGKRTEAARRGRAIFRRRDVGCATCHPPGLFTDLKTYDLGSGEKLDTPTLVEAWRTAPYLHDGSAATLREVLTTKNPGDRHGRTSHLSARELDDLIAYLLSL
jgi:DNA-binding beta-propeller fold protein YncE/mono/diheme cytochrome c family protein